MGKTIFFCAFLYVYYVLWYLGECFNLVFGIAHVFSRFSGIIERYLLGTFSLETFGIFWISSDLKFVATVTTGGRVKIFPTV